MNSLKQQQNSFKINAQEINKLIYQSGGDNKHKILFKEIVSKVDKNTDVNHMQKYNNILLEFKNRLINLNNKSKIIHGGDPTYETNYTKFVGDVINNIHGNSTEIDLHNYDIPVWDLYRTLGVICIIYYENINQNKSLNIDNYMSIIIFASELLLTIINGITPENRKIIIQEIIKKNNQNPFVANMGVLSNVQKLISFCEKFLIDKKFSFHIIQNTEVNMYEKLYMIALISSVCSESQMTNILSLHPDRKIIGEFFRAKSEKLYLFSNHRIFHTYYGDLFNMFNRVKHTPKTTRPQEKIYIPSQQTPPYSSQQTPPPLGGTIIVAVPI